MNFKAFFLATIVATGFTQLSFANGSQKPANDETNIPGVAAQPDSYFFTGKPYDKELGGYVFAARTYDPELCRWTTPDPSGFPDGPNNRIYTPVPTSELDFGGFYTINNLYYTPTNNSQEGLLAISPTQPQFTPAGQNNSFTYNFQVGLAVPGSAVGYIVQKVFININAYVYEAGSSTATQENSTQFYWEAWTVNNGHVGFGAQDNFGLQPNFSIDGSHSGNVTYSGAMEFFSFDFFNNQTGNNNPINWAAGSVNAAGILPATTIAPSWGNYLTDPDHTLFFGWE